MFVMRNPHLMQHGADVNAHGMCVAFFASILTCDVPCFLRNDLTALHIAVTKNRKNMVLLLLEKGADVGARNKCDTIDLILLLLLLMMMPNMATTMAILMTHTRCRWGSTALHAAAAESRNEMVELLLMRSADVNALSDRYTPALIYLLTLWLLPLRVSVHLC